ncbi:MAG: YdhR family protein [Candidatus Promineifilaceae bacterium]|nr:YdhR family protein [Candidatus Promineifilaceae bacterium]
MAKRILQVNFKFPESMDLNSPKGQEIKEEGLQHTADFPGLEWKIWIRNEERGEFGGIYLFEDEESLQNYLDGETMGQVRTMRDVSVKSFAIMEEPTRITDGPVELHPAQMA